MKRLLLTLSLICLSWGAGANDFGTNTGVVFKGMSNFVPLNQCLVAAQKGYELTTRIKEFDTGTSTVPTKSYEANRQFLYENQLFILTFYRYHQTELTGIMCRMQTL